MKNNNNFISRRHFLRTASLAAGAMAFVGCDSDKNKTEQTPGSTKPQGKMTMRTNTSTGDSVSILGFGCMRLPRVDEPESEIDKTAVDELVDYAMAHGVNYYDSSPVYCKGESEQIMGESLSRYPRDSYFIATKLSNFDPSTYPKEKSVEMFKKSLEYFKTDYLDYYLLHSIGGGGVETMRKRYIENGMLDYLKEQRAKGVIRNLGFSYHGDINAFNELLKMHDDGDVHWDFVQIQLNYINWEHPAESNGITARWLYEELEKRNISCVIMEPLLGGRLANVPSNVHSKMKSRRPDASPASWAFRFAAQPGVLTVLSGMTYMEHLEDNTHTYSSLEPLSDDETDFLMVCAKNIADADVVPCTACAYCMPCPYGIDIPGIFAHYNKCLNEDRLPLDKRDPQYVKARKAYLIGYDRAVEKLRQADRCISCGTCLSACPQSIDIPKQLKRINSYTEQLKQNTL